MITHSILRFWPAAALLAVSALSADAQVTCNTSSAVAPLARAEGKTEPVGDLILICTGGTPTPAGFVIPAVNFTLFLNTDLTSRVTTEAMGADFSEALLLVDEPNTLENPNQRPLLNCGYYGAPDNGPSGPSVCTVISNGIYTDSYDGTQNVEDSTFCDGLGTDPAPNTYGCGRPNAFQGRMFSANAISFLGVPFDPPGAGTRIFRFTNLRGNAYLLAPTTETPISAEIAVNGSTSIIINNPQQTLGFATASMTASVPTPSVVHITEDFASAFKPQNMAMTTTNGVFSGGAYLYTGGTAYPTQQAQNVPGVIYNSEDMFQWQNNGLNAPPTPNPPVGFSSTVVANIGNPLLSAGLGIFPTNIQQDGISNAGTRIALTFTKVPGHATVTVPSLVYLHKTASPGPNSGVMVLTSTDSAGAGPFTPGASTTIPEGGIAVYEVLFADPFAIEFADIPVTVNHSGNGARVSVSYAPFYSSAASGNATPTSTYPSPTAIPRFTPATGDMKLK